MARQRTSYVILSAAIFIVLEVAALVLLSRSSTIQNIWLNKASHRTVAVLWSGGESIGRYFGLKKENEALAEENALLRTELAQLREMEQQLKERNMVTELPDAAYSYIPAAIVKMDRGSAHSYIILNKGSEDGVQPQSGIITEKGIVGIVSAVDRHYSYGMTLMNQNFVTSTMVGPNRVSAPLRWDGISSNGGVVSDIPPHYEIQPGDTVRTSGFSNLFPADIVVGVTTSSRLVNGSMIEARVELFQDFNSLHYVTIVNRIDGKEIDELEKKNGR